MDMALWYSPCIYEKTFDIAKQEPNLSQPLSRRHANSDDREHHLSILTWTKESQVLIDTLILDSRPDLRKSDASKWLRIKVTRDIETPEEPKLVTTLDKTAGLHGQELNYGIFGIQADLAIFETGTDAVVLNLLIMSESQRESLAKLVHRKSCDVA
ncbi:hypothetical protein TEQG_03595 [Trichophyton equinum CBS 127.97]|uniref:Uncharacterized protein n=1 Tax=Trichophyton equinum (strain ATCC MYA-4606 / CBS 127.97) TaxID=559882 RepID=F2PR76_TRIEC|nr:hypothetical protein TEQG_03595 [Trichophyton equinum CBS 127.97]